MGKDKKKWYQTGEFEDGYQFGDIFRTVKNAANQKKDKAEANRIKKKAIATNSKQERDDSKKNRYFQKGALKNGDIGAAIKGTDRDVKTDLGAGFLSIGEKFIDWIATVAEADTEARMRQAQNDAIVHNAVWGGKESEEEIIDKYEKMIQENKKQTADFIKNDLYNERDIANKIVAGYYAPNRAIKNKNFSVEGVKKAYKEEKDYIDNDMESDSVLAEKSDALAETTGHYIGQIVLSKVGVPWYLTAYTTGAGGETENALNQGATLDKAIASGAWAGGGEVASELMFGGPLSKTGLDDLVAKKVGNIFTNSFLKGLSKFGIKALGEGIEEPIASGIARFGQWLTYQDDKTLKEMLWSEEAREEYVDSFIGGLFLGSMGQTGEVIKSKAHGVDYVAGLTKSESKVVDEVYKDAIFEVTKSGKELTHKEKIQIYDNAIQSVKSGKVDTQTIEAALGGEEYRAYKNALGNYNTLQQKLNEIKTAGSNAKTQEQEAGEIEQRLEQVKLQADKLKNILENKVNQKIDTDNIHLKDRESYLLDGYIEGIRKPIDNKVDNSNSLKNFDEKAFVEGIWEDSPNKWKKIVEKGRLETFDNNNEAWYNKNDIITDGSHLVNGKLKPNVKYKSGEYNYIYETDEFGDIARVHVEELKHTERKYRKRHKQNTSGKQKGDHAGHLIADRFGGSAELDNLVSQSALVNLSEYKKLENIWDRAIKKGQKVSFDMQVKYDENSSRPSEFIVEYRVDGIRYKRTINN